MAIGQFMPIASVLPPLELEFFAAASQDGTTILTWPSGIQAGDLAIGLAYRAPLSSPQDIYFDGFVDLFRATSAAGTGIMALQAYICSGTEGGAITGANLVPSTSTKAVAIFRGNRPIKSFSLAGYDYYFANGTPQRTVPYSGSGRLPILCIGGFAAETSASGRSSNPEQTVATATSRITIRYGIYNTSTPETQSVSMHDVGNNNLALACFIEVS